MKEIWEKIFLCSNLFFDIFYRKYQINNIFYEK